MIQSESLAELEGSLEAVSSMLALDASLGDPPMPEKESLVKGLRGGSAVLVVGSFEEYLRTAIEEHFTVLATDPPLVTSNKLPERLWVTSVFQSLKTALDGPKYVAKTERKDRLGAIVNASRRVVDGRLDPGSLAYAHSNPSAATVKTLFHELGMPNLFDTMRPRFDVLWGQPEAMAFIQDKLDEIVSRRHRVAHSAYVLGIARQDLTTSVKFIQVLCQCIDVHIKEHIQQVVIAAT